MLAVADMTSKLLGLYLQVDPELTAVWLCTGAGHKGTAEATRPRQRRPCHSCARQPFQGSNICPAAMLHCGDTSAEQLPVLVGPHVLCNTCRCSAICSRLISMTWYACVW
jgi:hypothetical protein